MEEKVYTSPHTPPATTRGNRRRIGGYLVGLLGLALFARISWIALTWENLSEEETNRVYVLSTLGVCMMVAGTAFVLWSRQVALPKS
jgi:hypothetical protein